MKIATLKFIGRQEGFGRIPAFDMYNITALSEPDEKLAVRSTVTIDSVRSRGYAVRFTMPESAATSLAPQLFQSGK